MKINNKGKTSKGKKLSVLQENFVLEYLKCNNASEAARRAGYSKKTSGVKGHTLLQDERIRKRIDERLKELESSKIADINELLMYLTSVVRNESESEEIVIEATGEGCSLARTMTKKPNEQNKLKAAETLLKIHGAFVDKVEEKIDLELNVSIDYGEDDSNEDNSTS